MTDPTPSATTPTDTPIPEPSVRVTNYVVTVLPEDNINQPTWSIDVTYRGEGRWALMRGSLTLNRTDGRWEWNSIPEDGREEWLAAHRFTDVDEALAVAKAMAPFLRINGLTALDVLARADR